MIELNREDFLKLEKNKRLFTAGPSSLVPEALNHIKGCFGRNDQEYSDMKEKTYQKLMKMSGQENIVGIQGSATLAIEIAINNFVSGKVLIVQTGYYSKRLEKICERRESSGSLEITIANVNFLDKHSNKSYDWIVACYTETSNGYRINIKKLKELALTTKSRLILDATASIGLEQDHNLADIVCFSSCKGLFALTGAAFIAYKHDLSILKNNEGYYNIKTHISGGVTGPYHQIQSIYGTLEIHRSLVESVRNEKKRFMEIFSENLIFPEENQPLLCTSITKKINYAINTIRYQSREESATEVVCHIGGLLSMDSKSKIEDYLKIETN